MDVVSEAVAAIGEQLAVLSKACDEVSHRELITLLVELTRVLRSVPALEYRVLARLREETEPCRLGEAKWPTVLATALRISSAEAKRRLARAPGAGSAAGDDRRVAGSAVGSHRRRAGPGLAR